MISTTALWLLSPNDSYWVLQLCDLALPVLERNSVPLPDRVKKLLDEGRQVAAGSQAGATFATPKSCGTEKMPAVEINTRQVAAILGVSEQAVRARCARGTLPARKSPAGWRFDRNELAEYVAARGVA